MIPSFAGRRLLAIGAIGVAAAIAVPRFMTHTPYERLGITLDWRRGQDFPRVDGVVGPPAKFLLRKGDELRGIDGVMFQSSQDMREHLKKQKGWPRGPFTLAIGRGGKTLDVVVPPLELGAWQRLRLFLYQVAAVIAAPLVAFLLVWRRPDLGTAWAFLWFATLQGLAVIWELYRNPQFEATGAFRLYLGAYHALVLWFPASFLHFMTVFPRPRWSGHSRWRSVWFWLVAGAYAVPLVLISQGLKPGSSYGMPYLIFQSIGLPLGVVSLLGRYARPAILDWRPTMSERVLAMVVALVLLLAAAISAVSEDSRMIALFQFPVVRLLFTVTYIAWLASPLLIAYLIANDPAFDPRRLIVRSIPYALLTGVLAALYLGTVVVAERLFAAATGEEAMLLNVVAALIVAFAFAPLRERLQRWVDRLYGRDPRALRAALDQSGRELLGALDRDEVKRSVEEGLRRGLKRPVAVEWPERGTPRLADLDEVREDARGAVDNLMVQAGIRLENLSLQEERAIAERGVVELREAATRAELRALHAQIQPHFLFNALNALSYLTETDPRAAQRFTERLADMLRYTVEAGERPAALLSEEIAFVEDYLGVARERYESALHFEYRGSEDLLSAAVPPLLLQPLVENSLKHGCSPESRALHLALEACATDGWLTLVFCDDGVAQNGEVAGFGLGLDNLKQRVRRFGGAESSMSAGPRAGGGFAVTLRWRLSAWAAA